MVFELSVGVLFPPLHFERVETRAVEVFVRIIERFDFSGEFGYNKIYT
jgi:hypothetical protein